MRKYNLLMLITACLAFLFINIAYADATNAPQYSDYPAVVLCKKTKPVTLDLTDNKQAQAFQTRLQAAARKQPNFAGHYILTSWGCGAFCQTIAIIDAQTGKVYMPRLSDKNWDNYLVGWTYEKPRVDSRLLVITAQLATTPRSNPDSLKGPFKYAKAYYQWQNDQLVSIQ